MLIYVSIMLYNALMINVTIVDNDIEAIQTISSYLIKYQNEEGVSFCISSFLNEIDFLESAMDYDILFLDINMPYKNGIDVAKEIRERGYQGIICFLTNYAQYAIDGYSVNAFDFIIKNNSYENFRLHIQRILKALSKEITDIITITYGYNKISINLKDIYYFESMGHQLYIYTKNKVYCIWESIKVYKKKLTSYGFYSCHESYLIHLCKIEEVRKNSVIILGKEIAISRNKKKEFLDWYRRYIL